MDTQKTLDKSFDFVGDNQLDGGDRLGDEQSDNDCATASDANIVSTSDTKPHKKLNKSTGKRKKPPRDPNGKRFKCKLPILSFSILIVPKLLFSVKLTILFSAKPPKSYITEHSR